MAAIVCLAALIGITIIVTDAPFWLFYIAPLAMAPLLILELRRLDRGSSD